MPYTPDRLQWTDEIPRLKDIYSFGGVSGLEYAYVTPDRLFDLQAEKWSQTKGAPAFKLIGPKGEATFILVERGQYAYQTPGSTMQKLSVDYKLFELTGIDPAPWLDEHEAVEVKVEPKKGGAPTQKSVEANSPTAAA